MKLKNDIDTLVADLYYRVGHISAAQEEELSGLRISMLHGCKTENRSS